MKKVTVFVPIEMNIEGIDRTSEVQRILTAMAEIISQSELEADPRINVELVGDAEIVNDDNNFTPKEKAILSEAGELLSVDDDDDLIFMVKAIINHENQDELIDHIDGVYVWQKVELEFTAKEFCEKIGYTGNEFKN